MRRTNNVKQISNLTINVVIASRPPSRGGWSVSICVSITVIRARVVSSSSMCAWNRQISQRPSSQKRRALATGRTSFGLLKTVIVRMRAPRCATSFKPLNQEVRSRRLSTASVTMPLSPIWILPLIMCRLCSCTAQLKWRTSNVSSPGQEKWTVPGSQGIRLLTSPIGENYSDRK